MTAQPSFCASCGKQLMTPYQFCGNCGAAVGTPQQSWNPPAGAPSWSAPQPNYGYAYDAPALAMRPAGFWVRFVASLIDGVVLIIANGILSAIITEPITSGLISIAVGVGYSAGLESSSSQATLGKRAMGLVVTDDKGVRLTFARAMGRYFAKILSAVILGVGYIMAAFSDRKRALHDMIAGTLVVYK